MTRIPSQVRISKVWFEHHISSSPPHAHYHDALGINESSPRISWRFEGTSPDWVQSRYKLDIGRNEDTVFEDHEVVSEQNSLVQWPSHPLLPRERVTVRVKAYSESWGWTPWSGIVSVEAGLWAKDWTCGIVESPREDVTAPCPPALFRREFVLSKVVKSARLYISAHGVYEAQLNGTVVGDHVLAPGWTSYQHELLYQTFNVTTMVKEGGNALGVEVAEGWYVGRLGFNGGVRNIWGDKLGLIAQLTVRYEDGTEETIQADDQWKVDKSPTTQAEIYDGESYDARILKDGWSKPGYNDTQWSKADFVPLAANLMRAPDGPPIRRLHTINAKTFSLSPSNTPIIDFGQNLVGWIRVKFRGKKGQKIVIRHTEALENGELCTRILRDAKSTDSIILGDGEIVWEPKFTFHGFRYVEITGLSEGFADLNLRDFEAVVIHTDMERTGWFECSNPMLNRLHDNVLWSMRSNFVGLPTDCPNRDERFGYTGDLQVFAPTASFLYHPHGMLKTWLRTVYYEQREEGNGVPGMSAPRVFRSQAHEPRAVWGDAMQIAPWELYKSSGDSKLLEDHYESMVLWIEQGITRDSRNLWDPAIPQLGDWLDPAAPPEDPGRSATDSSLVSNAYLIHITDLMSKICTVLSLPHEARRHNAIATAMRHAFQNEYITPNGRLINETQTAYALAIHFNLLTPAQLSYAATRLAHLIPNNYGLKVGTGFAGSHILGHALTAIGLTPLMYGILLQAEYPSWLYPITMGATTIWERWNSMFPDGTINSSGMTSFNHYAFGSVADWMHTVIGGLSPLEPGWKKILVEPQPGGNVRSARAKYLSPAGMTECSWDLAARILHVRVVIPPNTTATIRLPGYASKEVGSGVYEWVVEIEGMEDEHDTDEAFAGGAFRGEGGNKRHTM